MRVCFFVRLKEDGMALSLAEIIILCLVVDYLFRRMKVPGLIGMLAIGTFGAEQHRYCFF